MFRDYVEQLVELNKKFIIIGHQNAIGYVKIFKLIIENKIWLGCSVKSGELLFGVPDDYPLSKNGSKIDDNGKRLTRVSGIRWFTNLSHNNRNDKLELTKKYSQEEYPSYDNYNAINVNRTKDIPMDFNGIMGVPITFIDKYNQNQFEIIGIANGRFICEAMSTKNYINVRQVNEDGTLGKKDNISNAPVILLQEQPDRRCYVADNSDGYLVALYVRLLIKHKIKK